MIVKTTLKLSTYSCKLDLIVTDQVKVVIAKIYKKHKLKNDIDYEVEGILLCPGTNDYFLLLDTKYLTHNTIAHEIYHASSRICEDRDVHDEEAKSWLAGYITGEMYKFLEKKNLQVKHGR
jgi:hypothetical protein